jgi:hypothetical protein
LVWFWAILELLSGTTHFSYFSVARRVLPLRSSGSDLAVFAAWLAVFQARQSRNI